MMKSQRLAAMIALVTVLAACATWRWSGSAAPDRRTEPLAVRPEPGEAAPPAPRPAAAQEPVALSTSPAPAAVRPAVPQAPPERRASAQFYSDLGPESVDVSAYPTQQRYNYSIFVRICSSCHTLARPINAPFVTRAWWEFYMLGMRMRSRWRGRPFPREDVKAVLDFMEYDSHARKVDRRREFEAQTRELKSRFDAVVAEKLGKLQQSLPETPDRRIE